jgi:PAS domain-containing protein
VSAIVGFSLVYLLAAVIALAAAAVIWPRRDAPGGAPLALMLTAAAFWAVCDAIELYLPSVAGKRLVSQFQYIGVISAAPFLFHAAMELAGLAARLTPRLLALVWGIPLASLAMAWTSQWHGLLWTNIRLPQGDLPFSIYEYGWWFWVLTAQHYLLMIAASLILLSAIRRVRRQFRTGMIAVLVAVILPWVGNAAYNAKLGPWPGLNWLTLSLGVSGSILVWVVLREGLLDLLPRAREALVDKMTDAVLVLDHEGQVLFANNTTQTLSIDAASLAKGLGLKTLHDAPAQWRAEAQVESGGTTRWFDVHVDPVRDRWGAISGRLLVAREVTLQKALEDERERLIDELQVALKKVTQLEGLLPICANCRKVRDDGGYWGNVEEYFESRAPVEFTHAICPDCMPKLYPSIMNR